MLSEEQKADIHAEMRLRDETQREIAKTNALEESGWSKFINSSFAVTVFGGLVLAGVGYFLQSHAAHQEREASRRQQIQDKKYELFATASRDLESSLVLQGRLQLKWIWLAKNGAGAVDEFGYSKKDVLAETREIWKLYASMPKPNATFAQIKALFKNPDVGNAISALNSTADDMLSAKSENAVESYEKTIPDKLDVLTRAMGREIGKPDE